MHYKKWARGQPGNANQLTQNYWGCWWWETSSFHDQPAWPTPHGSAQHSRCTFLGARGKGTQRFSTKSVDLQVLTGHYGAGTGQGTWARKVLRKLGSGWPMHAWCICNQDPQSRWEKLNGCSCQQLSFGVSQDYVKFWDKGEGAVWDARIHQKGVLQSQLSTRNEGKMPMWFTAKGKTETTSTTVPNTYQYLPRLPYTWFLWCARLELNPVKRYIFSQLSTIYLPESMPEIAWVTVHGQQHSWWCLSLEAWQCMH